MIPRKTVILTGIACLVLAASASAQAGPESRTYRLYHGITAHVNNPQGKDFTVTLDLRDLNIYANGPREVLFKIYDPEGKALVREVIPDDGVESKNYMPRIGGWDHELGYYALCYSRGTKPMVRFSAYSDPKRLASLAKRTFIRRIKGGKKGVYRVLIVGARDHYATLKIDPALSYGVSGHHTFLHGQGDMWKTSYIYVPKGTVGLHLAFAEPDEPRSRRFTLSAPDGKKLFDGQAVGSFVHRKITFKRPGQYDDKVLTMAVSSGGGDYLLKVTMLRPDKDYVGMGVEAVLTDNPATARALKGGAIYHDGQVFWQPFQVRFHDWLKANRGKISGKLHGELSEQARLMRLIGPGDGRGSAGWTNWGYAFGYYGCKIWRPGWLFMKRGDVPKAVKDIIREGLILGGDRLSFAAGMERVNGNAFAQISVALWYCQAATGDKINKERFNVYFDRFRTEGWGEGAGISKSGDCQEHFAHDSNYGSYIIDNWSGGIWIKNGILADTDDPRFQQTFNRIMNLFSYTSSKDADVYAWNARIAGGPVGVARKLLDSKRLWKSDPGPDFTVSVNGGDEWFAARRRGYYMLTFHGRLAPEWLVKWFYGQIGIGGGVICQLTIPGKGTVINSSVNGSYGKGMHLTNWRNYHVHSVVGTMWDGRPFASGISEHDDAKLTGSVVTSSGEVRDRPLRVARKYTYNADSIDCEVSLAPAAYESLLMLWIKDRPFADLREAYEMIPFNKGAVTLLDAGGKAIGAPGAAARRAKTVVIDCGGYGVRIVLDKPRKVLAGGNSTVLIQLIDGPAKAETVRLKYRLVPFGR